MADDWEVKTSRRAELDIGRLPHDVRREALDILEDMAHDPFPVGYLMMQRYNDAYRIRFGDGAYRIVYRVDRKNRLVKVFRVRPRAIAYRGMKKPPRPTPES